MAISIIIPVYNTESYLRKCLDSIVNQTYRELEIIIIDDGSTDGSGEICDEYKMSDSRIRVFHTENRGLSCARNLGLDEAKGEWIGFVDSDDWIETDMYEALLNRAVETEADVVECGVIQEYPNRVETWKREKRLMKHADAFKALLCEDLSDAVWNKLYRSDCFKDIRFPGERVYEEIATTYRVFDAVDSISTIEANEYHYRQRERSLTNVHNMSNFAGFWLSNKERYEYLQNKVDEESRRILLQKCAVAICRMWSNYYNCKAEERIATQEIIEDMHVFACRNYPMLGERTWNLPMRLGILFPHFNSAMSLRMASILNRAYKMLRGKSGT